MYALQKKVVSSAGPGIIAEHVSTVKVWIDQVWFSETRDQPCKGVAGKADIEKIISFQHIFGA